MKSKEVSLTGSHNICEISIDVITLVFRITGSKINQARLGEIGCINRGFKVALRYLCREDVGGDDPLHHSPFHLM